MEPNQNLFIFMAFATARLTPLPPRTRTGTRGFGTRDINHELIQISSKYPLLEISLTREIGRAAGPLIYPSGTRLGRRPVLSGRNLADLDK